MIRGQGQARDADGNWVAQGISVRSSLEAQLIDDIGAYTHDPLGYVRYAFPWGEEGTALARETGPRDWQAEILKEIGDLLVSGLGAGDAIGLSLGVWGGGVPPEEGGRLSGLGGVENFVSRNSEIGSDSEVSDIIGLFENSPYPDLDPENPQKAVQTVIEDPGQEVIRFAVASGHGIGKSALVSWIVLWAMSTMEDCRGVVTANTEGQLRTKTWPELSKWHRLCLNGHWFKCTATAIHSVEEARERSWRIDAVPWSENNTEAFAGLHNQGKRILVVFDEASAIHDKIWEVTEGALTDADTEIIWCAFGNPTRNTGRFREAFRKYRHRWRPRNIDSRTVEGTNKKQLNQWVEDYGEDSDFVKVRVRGMFPSASTKQYISTDLVDAAFGKVLRPEAYNFAPKIISVEPAWEGDDELVIGMRQGLQFWILHKQFKNNNDVEVANRVARYQDEHKADAVFIDGGYGQGIYSAGKTMGRQWRLVWFGSKPTSKDCLNKRSEMWKLTREWLIEGGAIPEDQTLYDDLIGPETVPRLDGKLQLEPKDAMKRRGIPSPNCGDALAITFAYPVRSSHELVAEHYLRGNKARTKYDPLKAMRRPNTLVPVYRGGR